MISVAISTVKTTSNPSIGKELPSCEYMINLVPMFGSRMTPMTFLLNGTLKKVLVIQRLHSPQHSKESVATVIEFTNSKSPKVRRP